MKNVFRKQPPCISYESTQLCNFMCLGNVGDCGWLYHSEWLQGHEQNGGEGRWGGSVEQLHQDGLQPRPPIGPLLSNQIESACREGWRHDSQLVGDPEFQLVTIGHLFYRHWDSNRQCLKHTSDYWKIFKPLDSAIGGIVLLWGLIPS